MTTTNSKWGIEQTNALKKLWNADPPIADPLRTDAEYIDQFFDNNAIFNTVVKKERFRHHYKEKSSLWLKWSRAHG